MAIRAFGRTRPAIELIDEPAEDGIAAPGRMIDLHHEDLNSKHHRI
jgi:hypothetical protein